MPYYHVKCRGQIRWYPFLPIPPKCQKCGQTWSFLTVFGPKRDDMTYVLPEYKGPKVKLEKGGTNYAPWADTLPAVAMIASRLPNWPRWLRILSLMTATSLISGLFYGLYLVGSWAVLTGIALLLISPLILFIARRKNK